MRPDPTGPRTTNATREPASAKAVGMGMTRWYQQQRASHGGRRAIHLCAFLIASLPCVTHPAGIVTDGGTATTVSTAANGLQTVNIAPAISGVSQNTYSSFNVSSAGAALNNVGINARTIVNQVTSSNPSLIEGKISVTGSRANVILANPNGITVNGGSFVNTGHVALTTGQVSFDDLHIAPGEIHGYDAMVWRAPAREKWRRVHDFLRPHMKAG